MLGKFFSGGKFFQRTTPPVRGGVGADSGGVRQCPLDVRRTSSGVRWNFFLAEGQQIRAEPGGVRAETRFSAAEGLPPREKPEILYENGGSFLL